MKYPHFELHYSFSKFVRIYITEVQQENAWFTQMIHSANYKAQYLSNNRKKNPLQTEPTLQMQYETNFY